ncbi:MAG: hypothetical protein FJ276_26000, partial [Planctomycetes bacterium]|nr:hypothetical protein [Planctomycetota bacterium]
MSKMGRQFRPVSTVCVLGCAGLAATAFFAGLIETRSVWGAERRASAAADGADAARGAETRGAGGSGTGARQWKTGAAFHRTLADRVDAVWSGMSLRVALERLAERQQVAIMLDRRIDPDRPVDAAVSDTPLDLLLLRLAAGSDATLSYIGPVVYVGPRDGTANLSVVAAARREEARRLPPTSAAGTRRQRAGHWPRLSRPRDLLDQLAEEAGVSIEGIEQIPHDLWPAGDLPALPWTDRMTLVLTGFDRTFRFSDDGRSVQLIPLDRPPLSVRTFPASSPSMPVDVLSGDFPG